MKAPQETEGLSCFIPLTVI